MCTHHVESRCACVCRHRRASIIHQPPTPALCYVRALHAVTGHNGAHSVDAHAGVGCDGGRELLPVLSHATPQLSPCRSPCIPRHVPRPRTRRWHQWSSALGASTAASASTMAVELAPPSLWLCRMHLTTRFWHGWRCGASRTLGVCAYR